MMKSEANDRQQARLPDWQGHPAERLERAPELDARMLDWTDPVSGDRLTVRLNGNNRFLDALEPLGFERSGTVGVEAFGELAEEAGLGGKSDPKPARRSWVSVKANLKPEDGNKN